MAFGPATFQVQQALQALLQGRALEPVPLAPTGGIGPLDLETTAALAALQPQPVPPQLPGPVDADAIRSRFAGLAGPEPVALQPGPDPLILRIARALQGFGAGVQGQGPQFLAGLREERERPQREFRARKERFEARGQELGVMAEQAVLSAEERRQARTLDLLDKQAERDFQRAVKQSGVKDLQAIERMRQAFDLERDAKKAEFERLEQGRKEAQQTKIELARLAAKYRALGAKGEIPTELAQKDLDPNFKLSRAAEKWFSARVALDEARAARAAGGGARQPRVMVEVVNDNGSLSVVPLTEQVNSQINAGMVQKGPRGIFMEGQPAQPAPTIPAPTFPEFSGELLLPAAAPAGQGFTRAEIEAYARKTKRDPKTVEADLRARGKIVQ